MIPGTHIEGGTEVLEPAPTLNCESEGEQGHLTPESGEVAVLVLTRHIYILFLFLLK